MIYVRGFDKGIGKAIMASDQEMFSINDNIGENKTKWKCLFERMIESTIPKKIMNYRPAGRNDLSRPGKKCLVARDRNM